MLGGWCSIPVLGRWCQNAGFGKMVLDSGVGKMVSECWQRLGVSLVADISCLLSHVDKADSSMTRKCRVVLNARSRMWREAEQVSYSRNMYTSVMRFLCQWSFHPPYTVVCGDSVAH